ncbi:MAG: SCP2 sterol-binding domain-containing protein [Alphaproteobacteria bacterium]|nr:SCP2 sterol-binding domain-containing protein [Alphaproteobacteria bacterium]NCQ88379.1 SCP2 sterol-binding domain-containing protein [Alphaproteobacteria bacterium]NCT05921.1 SCP2 sterol-binding domain-containing protein [Alphaproteobacteria bacterium]
MSLDEVTNAMKSKIAMASGLDAKVKFDFGDDGIIFVDATQNPAEINHEDNDADCTLRCKLDTFKGFMDGSQDPTMAFMMGKLKVDGSMGLVMKLNAIIED